MRGRGLQRRQGKAAFDTPAFDRRRDRYDRRGRPAVTAAHGMVRPGWAEAMPRTERRSRPEGGLE